MARRCSGTGGGNRRRSSGNKTSTPSGKFLAMAAMSGSGTQTSAGAGTMTATAALSSTGGMLGLMGTGSVGASAALTGSGSVVGTTYRLFPSTNGPSATTSYSGDLIIGVTFSVSTALSLQAYYYWAALGGDTTAQKYALWLMTGPASGTLVSGGTVTGGTLTLGQWNQTNLGSPVALTPNAIYVAATGWVVTNGFSITNNEFGSGDPYSAGITNGPLTAYSDTTGSNPVPSNWNFQYSYLISGSDPSTMLPVGGNSSFNGWLDILVG